MSNIENEQNQATEPQTSCSEVVEVGLENKVKTKPKREPRKPKQITVEKVQLYTLMIYPHS